MQETFQTEYANEIIFSRTDRDINNNENMTYNVNIGDSLVYIDKLIFEIDLETETLEEILERMKSYYLIYNYGRNCQRFEIEKLIEYGSYIVSNNVIIIDLLNYYTISFLIYFDCSLSVLGGNLFIFSPFKIKYIMDSSIDLSNYSAIKQNYNLNISNDRIKYHEMMIDRRNANNKQKCPICFLIYTNNTKNILNIYRDGEEIEFSNITIINEKLIFIKNIFPSNIHLNYINEDEENNYRIDTREIFKLTYHKNVNYLEKTANYFSYDELFMKTGNSQDVSVIFNGHLFILTCYE